VLLGASLGRALIELGHEVRLIPPAHVKPYVRRNKSDQVDAAAIYEAMSRPGQRFVPVRSIDNQAELMRHRARELLAGQRTAALNALRGHLAEIGLIAPQGAHHAYGLKRMAADGFNENGEIVVPDCVRGALRSLVGQIDALDEAIGAIDRELAASVKADETAKRLMTIPGVGPVTASAITATIQDASAFATWARVRRLPRLDATPELDRRQATARAHHQDGRPLLAQAAGRGRLRDAPPSQRP
jgi:transposase